MIGLDTNILVRYLTQDDPVQAETANKMILRSTNHRQLLWIGQVTLCETVWVLERAYKMPKHDMINIVHMLLQTQELVFEKHDIIWQALHDYKFCKSAGFVDCLIGRQNQANDCSFTYTFDKHAASELSTFKHLPY